MQRNYPITRFLIKIMKDNFIQPAFPVYEADGDGNLHLSNEGMSLRDWFAGQALVSMLNSPDTIGENTYAMAATLSFKFADAMLAARSQDKTSSK